MSTPTLPLDEGDRIVALENRDVVLNNEDRKVVHDFVAWRGELRSVKDLAAFRTVDRNMRTGDELPEPVKAAEMTAAGFRVARVAPLMGRYLVDDDERIGAPIVLSRIELYPPTVSSACHFSFGAANFASSTSFGLSHATESGGSMSLSTS
jgi:hypothetical protein